MKYFNQFGNITISLIRAHRLILVCLLLLIPIKVWAYRPFASTDADVVAANELEIELGYFNWERTSGENSYVTPQLVFNYGLTNTLELIAEFDLEHDLDGKSQPVDPGLFLKKVFKAGVLQDSEGVSFALEGGLLLPSAVSGENSTGFEAIGILSGSLSSFTWHLNLGGGVDRVDHNNFSLWGVILEHPVGPNLRLVAEFNGEKLKNEAADNSGLLGVIWEPSSLPGLAVDVGIRRGATNEAPNWGATLGLSFSF